jgi:8-oxo-dGTP pyrophosphatase MutT (NUDIX family)
MYITIHFGDKPVILADGRDAELLELLNHPETVLIEESSAHAVHAMLHEIKREEIKAGVMISNDLNSLQKHFWHRFQIIRAAGGLVVNERGDVLFIYRRGFWDLPKGKIDDGESVEACAIREIQEETGLQDLQLIKPLCTTYHTYEFKGEDILKESHWFLVQGHASEKLVPQTEEDIAEIIWADLAKVRELMKSTYPSIRAVFVAAGIN